MNVFARKRINSNGRTVENSDLDGVLKDIHNMFYFFKNEKEYKICEKKDDLELSTNEINQTVKKFF